MNKSHLRQYLTAFFSSLSALASGMSYVWTTPLLPRLQEPDAPVFLTHDDVSWVVSLIEVGNLFSPLPAAFLSDKIGRKPLLLFMAPLYAGTWLLVLFSRHIYVLYAIRSIQGMAIGVLYVILPMYLGEIAEPTLRGTVSVFFIGMECLGILAVFCIGPFVSYQMLTWICLFPPIIFGATFWFFPESPHFLLMKGKSVKAAESLKWLRGKNSLAGVNDELQEMMDAIREQSKTKASWKDVVLTRAGRKAILLMELVTMTMIMCGFTAVLSYSTDTFNKFGGNLIDPDSCTIIIGTVTASVILVSGSLVDRAGRRPILLVSSFGSFFCLAITAAYFFYIQEIDPGNKSYQWVPCNTLIVFVAITNFGLAALQPTLQAELFPNSTRSIASGITSFSICVMSFFVLYIYIPIQDGIGLYLVYTIYAGFAGLGTVLIYKYLPETKGRTFEEIQSLL